MKAKLTSGFVLSRRGDPPPTPPLAAQPERPTSGPWNAAGTSSASAAATTATRPALPNPRGTVPEGGAADRRPVGFQGPWGTTYPANLRLVVQKLTEAEWLAKARTAMRPPMPWFNLRDMKDDDLRAMYRYFRGISARRGTGTRLRGARPAGEHALLRVRPAEPAAAAARGEDSVNDTSPPPRTDHDQGARPWNRPFHTQTSADARAATADRCIDVPAASIARRASRRVAAGSISTRSCTRAFVRACATR